MAEEHHAVMTSECAKYLSQIHPKDDLNAKALHDNKSIKMALTRQGSSAI